MHQAMLCPYCFNKLSHRLSFETINKPFGNYKNNAHFVLQCCAFIMHTLYCSTKYRWHTIQKTACIISADYTCAATKKTGTSYAPQHTLVKFLLLTRPNLEQSMTSTN